METNENLKQRVKRNKLWKLANLFQKLIILSTLAGYLVTSYQVPIFFLILLVLYSSMMLIKCIVAFKPMIIFLKQEIKKI